MENWYCKPSSEQEAFEIVERAIANGVESKEVVGANNSSRDDKYSWNLCNGWGVIANRTFTLDVVDWEASDVIEYTIEQVREKFPLPADNRESGESSEDCLVKQPNHYMLFPEHNLEVKHIVKRLLDNIDSSDMDITSNQAGWLQQAVQYLLRCYAKGGVQEPPGNLGNPKRPTQHSTPQGHAHFKDRAAHDVQLFDQLGTPRPPQRGRAPRRTRARPPRRPARAPRAARGARPPTRRAGRTAGTGTRPCPSRANRRTCGSAPTSGSD